MRRAVLLVVAATLLSYPLGLALGLRWLLPILNTAPAYAALVHLLARERRNEAAAVMLAWAATLAVGATVSFALWPAPVDGLVLNGPAYRDEMFAWIRTGVGREGDVRQFLPQHLLHLAGFVLLCLGTASTLGIALGAVLMNYMGFYVASLFRAGVPLLSVLLFGWQPWALCRVAAFSVLGVVLAEPLLSRLRGVPWGGWRPRRGLLAWAVAGILADWVLKATLAPTWGRILRGALP